MKVCQCQSKKKYYTIQPGFLFGSTLAIVISWSINHSILWAVLHGIFGWFYVIYYILTRG